MTDEQPKELLSVFKGLKFHKDIGNFRYCPTGEPYQTVTSGGVKEEGAIIELFKSERMAIATWEKTISKILHNRQNNSIVFWRRMPEMRFHEPTKGTERYFELASNGGWSVYSRLIISDKPIIQDADYNK